MPLTNEELIKAEGNFVDEIVHDGKMKPFMERAEMELKRLIPDYTELESNLKSGNPSERAKACQKAETLLAISYSIIPLNTRASQKGGFIQSIGMKDGQTSLIDISEAEKLAAYYKQQAMDILKEWVDIRQVARDTGNGVVLDGFSMTAI